METENPYASPTTDPVHSLTETGKPELATLSDRFAGAFVDGLVNIAIIAPIYGVLFALGIFQTMDQLGNLGVLIDTMVGVVAFILVMLVQWKFLSSTGQTIGKRVMKTKIVTMAGDKPPMADLVGKRYAFFNLTALIPVVGGIVSLVNILMIFRKDRRCLHDLVAGTQVVKIRM